MGIRGPYVRQPIFQKVIMQRSNCTLASLKTLSCGVSVCVEAAAGAGTGGWSSESASATINCGKLIGNLINGQLRPRCLTFVAMTFKGIQL